MPVDNRDDVEDAVLTPPPDMAANVGTPSPGPEASSEPPPILEPQPVTDEAPSQEGVRAAPQEDPLAGEPLPSFDDRYTVPFEGLAYIGKLTRDFDWLGHKFRIRTLDTGENIEVGMVTAEYAGTMGEAKAYQTAVVAGCVVTVDGREPPMPLTNAPDDTPIANRFPWAKTQMPPTIDKIYEEYLLLEIQVSQVLRALGEASG